MTDDKIWSSALCVVLGILIGGVGMAYYDDHRFNRQRDYAAEFEVSSKLGVDWTKGVGEDVVVEFRTYEIRNGKKVQEGPSLSWTPAVGDRRVATYHNGSVSGVESRSVNVCP